MSERAIILECAWRNPVEAFAPFANAPSSVLLHSSDVAPGRGRWSYLCIDPFSVVTSKNGTARIDGRPVAGKPFDVLRSLMKNFKGSVNDTRNPALPPFLGGLAGFFAYDLGADLERLPPKRAPFAVDDQACPDLHLGLYDTVAAFDHHTERLLVISSGLPEAADAPRRKRAKARAEALAARLADRPPLPPLADDPLTDHISSNFTAEGYRQAVARVVDYIHAGDIFQANLSQRFEAHLRPAATPFTLYRRLTQESPAPYAAYVAFDEGALLSSSPESFLRLEDGCVTTAPIKGTRPRGETPTKDRLLAEELRASEKDRAENVMIVDLLRNDLSKVCADRSIQVGKLCELGSFANVHHLISEVTGRLRDEEDAATLLAACFPGGSITGAPKIRAMEIIAELEPTTRAGYCGAIGWLGFNGDMETNIAIRTMTVKDRRVTFQAGGGIVAGSDPQAEYLETLAKASAMRNALLGKALTSVPS